MQKPGGVSPKKFYSKPFSAFAAKKQLGQNFLVDPHVKRKIIEGCELNPEDIVLEIGAGLGALTEDIAKRTKHLFAIETDKQLLEKLKARTTCRNITFIHGDFLKYPLESFPRGIKAIGNLPYYITTPIIEKILMHRNIFTTLYITVQYELAMRMLAPPDTKTYGSFSCFVQYFAAVKKILKIKNTSFRPIPKVDSCFLKLSIASQPRVETLDEKLFFSLIRQAFQQRRKNILNALSAGEGKQILAEIFDKLGLKENLRAENLNLNNFADIANQLILWKRANGSEGGNANGRPNP